MGRCRIWHERNTYRYNCWRRYPWRSFCEFTNRCWTFTIRGQCRNHGCLSDRMVPLGGLQIADGVWDIRLEIHVNSSGKHILLSTHCRADSSSALYRYEMKAYWSNVPKVSLIQLRISSLSRLNTSNVPSSPPLKATRTLKTFLNWPLSTREKEAGLLGMVTDGNHMVSTHIKEFIHILWTMRSNIDPSSSIPEYQLYRPHETAAVANHL